MLNWIDLRPVLRRLIYGRRDMIAIVVRCFISPVRVYYSVESLPGGGAG